MAKTNRIFFKQSILSYTLFSKIVRLIENVAYYVSFSKFYSHLSENNTLH